MQSKEFLPVELVFHPNWWHANHGFDFVREFFFDPATRVAKEFEMGRLLGERFGQFGYHLAGVKPEPVIGPVHLAAGFVMAAIWGCEVRFTPGASPEALCRNLTLEQLDAMPQPDPMACREFVALVKLIEALKAQYGYVTGDINWSGVQNLAIDLTGTNILMGYYLDPERVHRIYAKLTRSIIDVVDFIRRQTGTSSISVNRSVLHVDPAINLVSNCTVQMISNEMYETFVLPHDIEMARRLQPYGVHHCGNNMHNVAKGYAKIPDCCFFDVGWGADVAECRRHLPDAFFNIRLSPVKLMTCTPDEVRSDMLRTLDQAGDPAKVGFCCINMDHGTPEENVAAIFETARDLRNAGG
jgi:uroporphyrinogen-III decarboxylase